MASGPIAPGHGDEIVEEGDKTRSPLLFEAILNATQ